MRIRPGRSLAVATLAVAIAGCTGAPAPIGSPPTTPGPSPPPATAGASASARAAPSDGGRAEALGDPGVLAVSLPAGWVVALPPGDGIPDRVGPIGFVALDVPGAYGFAVAEADPPAVVVLAVQAGGPGLSAAGVAGAHVATASDVDSGIFPTVERVDTGAGTATWIAGPRSHPNQGGSGPATIDTDEVTVVWDAGARIVTARVVMAGGSLAAREEEIRGMAVSAVANDAGVPPEPAPSTCDPLVEPEPGADPVLGQAVALDDPRHLEPGEAYAYPACPPASGPHAAAPAAPVLARVYGPGEPIPPQGWLHNLERGDVAVLYRCPDAACDDLIADLGAIVDALPPTPLCGRPGGALAARFDDMSAPLAVVAWGRIRFLDAPDPAVITAFYEATADRGPERPCDAAREASPGP